MIEVGSKVRYTADWCAKMRAVRITEEYIEKYRRGTVVSIEETPYWNCVTYVTSAGDRHTSIIEAMELDDMLGSHGGVK